MASVELQDSYDCCYFSVINWWFSNILFQFLICGYSNFLGFNVLCSVVSFIMSVV